MSSRSSKVLSTNMAQRIVRLDVGGTSYTSTIKTLTTENGSMLQKWFRAFHDNESNIDESGRFLKISDEKVFIDRDGQLFRYILDYLRQLDISLPNDFQEMERLRSEASFFGLNRMVKIIDKMEKHKKSHTSCSSHHPNNISVTLPTGKTSGYITIGYRGTFAFGRDGLADVKFRKVLRILVCGKVLLCREVFDTTLNESRDPDHHGQSSRYTARFYLKHNFLEQAFDALSESGFFMIGSSGNGTNSYTPSSAGTNITEFTKPGTNPEESRWLHYNEYVFYRS
ncbi:hypothetical protein SNEBB_006939 [Seison nebaliae]|nr:hypothetical protein SNEBB_006939 [Seison nebaliae]